MEISSHENASRAPDVLKRFVPTPLEAMLAVSGVDVLIHTNDPEMIDNLKAPAVGRVDAQRPFRWKLIYDSEASAEIGCLTLLECGRTIVANLGRACVIGLDNDRSELVAFIGLRGHEAAFREIIIPLLTALTLGRVDSFEFVQLTEKPLAAGGAHE